MFIIDKIDNRKLQFKTWNNSIWFGNQNVVSCTFVKLSTSLKFKPRILDLKMKLSMYIYVLLLTLHVLLVIFDVLHSEKVG